MWQNSNQKVRALATARKRDRERSRQSVHFKRINASIESAPTDGPKEVIEARVILNDFNTKGVSFFSPQLLPQGLSITLATLDPFKIVLHGRVVYCQEANATSHVISSIHFGYRIGMEFTPADEAEREALAKYCQDLNRNFSAVRSA